MTYHLRGASLHFMQKAKEKKRIAARQAEILKKHLEDKEKERQLTAAREKETLVSDSNESEGDDSKSPVLMRKKSSDKPTKLSPSRRRSSMPIETKAA